MRNTQDKAKTKDDVKDFTKNPTNQGDKYSHDDLAALEGSIDQIWRDIQEITQICNQHKQEITDQLQGISNINSSESQNLIWSIEEQNDRLIESLRKKLDGTYRQLSIYQSHLTTAEKNTQDEEKKEHLKILSRKCTNAYHKLLIALPYTETNQTKIISSAINNFENELQNIMQSKIEEKQSEQRKIDFENRKREMEQREKAQAIQEKANAKVDQSTLIDKFIQYMEIQHKSNLNEKQKSEFGEKEKKEMREGLCFGFSLVHSYMDATNQLPWWENMLRSISAMEVSEKTLAKSISPEGVTTDSWGEQTLGKTLERVAGYVLYHMWTTSAHVWEQDEKAGLIQQNFLSPTPQGEVIQAFSAMQDGEEKKISFNAQFSGNFNSQNLIALLETMKPLDKNSFPGVTLIQNMNHAITVRWNPQKNGWGLYDPNSTTGEKAFSTTKELSDFLKKVYGNALSINIFSWEKPETNQHIRNIEKYHAEFYTSQKLSDLLADNGLPIMVGDNPEQLHKLIVDARTNLQTRNSILSQLESDKNNGWQKLGCFFLNVPTEIPNLIEITKENQEIRMVMIDNLDLTDRYKSTRLHAIANNPAMLTKLLTLAKTDQSLSDEIKKLLFVKNSEGISVFKIITEKSPETLPQLHELFKNNWTEDEKKLIESTLAETKKVAANKHVETTNMVSRSLGASSSFFWQGKEKTHRGDLLVDPTSHAEDKTDINNVIRAIGREFAKASQSIETVEKTNQSPTMKK